MERDPQTYAIIGAAMEVHRKLGQGFLELVYKTALGIEFRTRGIAYETEVPLAVKYKGEWLTCFYRADFVCFENIVIEIKAIAKLTGADDAQLINELKATGFHRGVLLNFGASSLEYRRLVFGL